MSVCFEAVERPNNYKIKNMTQKDVELSKFVMSKFFGEEEALNKGLIYTAISPWIFRYHFFKHYVAKSQPQESLGRSLPIRPTKLITESLSSILIDSQECLSKQTSEFKLNEIKKLISSVE